MPDERDISPASGYASLPAGDRGGSPQEGPWRADAHAVVIGINTYLDPKVPDLRFARADAEAVYKVLTDPEVGRFKPENVTLLVDAEATERRIRSALGTALPRRARRDSTVCIYFAGHGAPDIDHTRTASDGIAKYLIPHDAVADDLRSSGISMDAVQQYFSYLDANQVVCFLDCCYSGAAGGRSFEREGFQTRALLSDEFLDGLASEGRLVITACAASEVSLESQDKGHGLFTYHLVEGLRGAADTGGDGLVTIDELYDYVYLQVERDARSLGGSMKPVRKGSVQGRVYLTEYETTAKKRIRLASEEASAAWARGNVDEATKLWSDVLALDAVHEPALRGLAHIAERRVQEQAAREEAARRRDEELQRKHQVLLGFFENEQLTAGEYERALGLLDEEVSSLSEIDRRRRRVLDNLIAGSLTLKTYKQSLAAIAGGARRDEPSRPPVTAPPALAPSPPPGSSTAPPLTVTTMSPPEEPAVVGDGPGSPPESPRLLPLATRPQDDAERDRPSFRARTALTSLLNRFTGVKRWFAVGLGLVVVVAMILYGIREIALASIQAACNNGDGEKCSILAHFYFQGRYGLSQDVGQGTALYEKACDLGYGPGCDTLGHFLAIMEGPATADRFFVRGCDLGNAESCITLGIYMRKGHGGRAQSDASAAAMFTRVCESQGGDFQNPSDIFESCSLLAGMYESGSGVPKDLGRAIELYRKACANPNQDFACEQLKRLQAQ